MPRGGRRQGRPGQAYPQRQDLTAAPRPLPISTVPGQTYGAATEQRAAQQAVPMASGPLTAPPVAAPAPTGAPPMPPGEFGAFDRPSERPSEPVTTGLPTGPGAGPEVLGAMNPTHDELRALYSAFPNEDLRELLEDLDTGV